jgi:hypothetical protein
MSNSTQATNGYMIRLEVLKMALGIVEQEFHTKRDVIQSQFQMAVDFARAKANAQGYSDVEFPTQPELPAFPTPEEIKNKASELYQFITTK